MLFQTAPIRFDAAASEIHAAIYAAFASQHICLMNTPFRFMPRLMPPPLPRFQRFFQRCCLIFAAMPAAAAIFFSLLFATLLPDYATPPYAIFAAIAAIFALLR